ncbi:MAG: hypothetical protein IJX69_03150 [Oscillospiraceae bacterium]|nr:hypothetical protein [Oscillospiraceae bacterium]
MQQSGGLLLADGWTEATHLFSPKMKMQIDSRTLLQIIKAPVGVLLLFLSEETVFIRNRK